MTEVGQPRCIVHGQRQKRRGRAVRSVRRWRAGTAGAVEGASASAGPGGGRQAHGVDVHSDRSHDRLLAHTNAGNLQGTGWAPFSVLHEELCRPCCGVCTIL
jgi:hypothetical protein